MSFFDRAAQTFEKPRHKQLAQIKAAYILAGDGRYDDVRSRVGALAQPDQPYEYLARELLGFAAMQSGDMTTARKEFSYLDTIPGVTETIAARASQYLSLMAVDAAANAPVPSDETETVTEDAAVTASQDKDAPDEQ